MVLMGEDRVIREKSQISHVALQNCQLLDSPPYD